MTHQEAVTISVGAVRGHWLNVARLTVYPRIFLAVFVIAGIAWLSMSDGLLDPKGKPVGYDFITFWAASDLTLAGDPAAAFDLARIYGAERSAVPRLHDIFAWHYPPTFQLLSRRWRCCRISPRLRPGSRRPSQGVSQ